MTIHPLDEREARYAIFLLLTRKTLRQCIKFQNATPHWETSDRYLQASRLHNVPRFFPKGPQTTTSRILEALEVLHSTDSRS